MAKEKTKKGHVHGRWVWDIVLTDDEIAALASGVSPVLIRPDHLQNLKSSRIFTSNSNAVLVKDNG